MYTVEDIATRYCVTIHTVLGWIKTGELKSINVGRSHGAKKPRWRITEQALVEFEALRTPAPPLPRAARRKRVADVVEFY